MIPKGASMQIRSLMFLVLACLLATPAVAQDKAIAWQGKGASGETIDFQPQALRGPAVLLFWATWCPYCKALMPYLQHVYDAAGKDKLDVYAIDFKDEDGDRVAILVLEIDRVDVELVLAGGVVDMLQIGHQRLAIRTPCRPCLLYTSPSPR